MTFDPSAVRGTNYLVNEAEIVGNWFNLNSTYGTYDTTVVTAELDHLESVGCTSIRVFQSYWCWVADKAEHVSNLTELATLCAARGISIHLVMFDVVESVTQWENPNETTHPIYDWLGAGGTQSWDPSAASNAHLANGSTGLLDLEVADLAAVEATYDILPGYYASGSWAAGPGGNFELITPCENYVYPNEPTGDLGTLWTSFKDYITQTINACGAALSSIDLGNENDAKILQRIALTNNATLADEYLTTGSQGGDVIDYRVDNVGSLTQAYKRVSYFLKWFLDYVRAQHPTVPVTIGWADLAAGLNMMLAGTLYGGQNLRVDWYDWHLYSTGEGLGTYLDAYTTQIAADWSTHFPGYESLGQTVSEWFRHTNGANLNAARNAYAISQRSNAGGWMWGYFESHGFGTLGSLVTNWGPSASPAYDIYPETGLVHSYIDGATHKIEVRSTTAAAFLAQWFQGATLTEPRTWTPTYLKFAELAAGDYPVYELRDQDGTTFASSANEYVNWRWMVGTAAEIAAAQVLYPGIGKCLDTATQQTVRAAPGYKMVVPIDPNSDMTSSQMLAVQAWYGETEYAVDSFYSQEIQMSEVLTVTQAALLSLLAGQDAETVTVNAMSATGLWIEVKKLYNHDQLMQLTNIVGGAGATAINDANGINAAQSVLNLWPAYAQIAYDSTNTLHVEVAAMGVIAKLQERGGSASGLARQEWDKIFGDGGVIEAVKNTGPRGKQTPTTNSGLTHRRENWRGHRKIPWSEDTPSQISPRRRRYEY